MRGSQSMTWLRAKMDDQDKSIVSTLWFAVCRKYKSRAQNFWDWVTFQQTKDLWWSDSLYGRRVNQKLRKEYQRQKKSSTHASSDYEDDSTDLDFDMWDSWFHGDEESLDSSHSSDWYNDMNSISCET